VDGIVMPFALRSTNYRGKEYAKNLELVEEMLRMMFACPPQKWSFKNERRENIKHLCVFIDQ
jgi:hypothetical protein